MNDCNAASGFWAEFEAVVEVFVTAEDVDEVAGDEPALPERLCSSAWTIVLRKLDGPDPVAPPIPLLPSLSPSETLPLTCCVELDELEDCCNQAQLFEPETPLIELMKFSFKVVCSELNEVLLT